MAPRSSSRRSKKRKFLEPKQSDAESAPEGTIEITLLAPMQSIANEKDQEAQVARKRIRRPNPLFFEDVESGRGNIPKQNPSFDEFPDVTVRKSQGSVHNSVPVEQFDPSSGVVVHRYSSQREASIAMRTSHRTIARCCRGEIETVQGFGYRFYRGSPINCRYTSSFCEFVMPP